jgi:hypothetical protein
MVTVTMRMRWRNQRGKPLDKLQWGEHQIGAAIRLRFGQVVNQPLRVDGLQPLQGERRAGTVAQQPLEPGPVIGLDPDRGIDREAAAVAPLCHVLCVILFEIALTDEPAKHPLPNPRLYPLNIGVGEQLSLP